MHRLSGARVLLTGATSGIGRFTAEKLLKSTGIAALGVVGRSGEALESLQQHSSSAGRVHAGVHDLGNLAEIHDMIRDLGKSMGGIDVLISNAGMPSTARSVNGRVNSRSTCLPPSC
jgi:NADP-dependent 3-hydroxy acid dehydrogenase YdfG